MLGDALATLPMENIPTVYAVSRSTSRSSSSRSASSDPEPPTAYDVIVHLLTTTGRLMYVALLHGYESLFAASARNLRTGVCEFAGRAANHWADRQAGRQSVNHNSSSSSSCYVWDGCRVVSRQASREMSS